MSIELSLTSNTYRRSATDAPELVATTTLSNAEVLTIELRAEKDNGTILENDFRIEHFTFYDITTDNEVVTNNPFPGTCEPRDALYPYNCVELKAFNPLVTKQMLDDMSPLSDPVRQLEAGHEYRITLLPQTVWYFAGSKEELFRGRSSVPAEELPEGEQVTLKSVTELRLKVEP